MRSKKLQYENCKSSGKGRDGANKTFRLISFIIPLITKSIIRSGSNEIL